ncbi:metastasis-associated protein MTA3-like [Dermatophagoides pteronyssinus]|uniref:metastasis-associated protein MTA3-like n=1 Tax=Dermatophagoides pteronyssinus TaxID=6956 RepID=UPI003F68092E
MATALTSNYLTNNSSSSPSNQSTNSSYPNQSSSPANGYQQQQQNVQNFSNSTLNNNNSTTITSNIGHQQQQQHHHHHHQQQHSSQINHLSSSTSSSSSSPNLYRVGDYVYIEITPSTPYQVCKIEELIKNQNGNPEVKLVIFYRRRDMSGSLFQQIEKHQISALEEEQEKEYEQLSEKEKHQIKLREIFLSRQLETYPVSSIRGKCQVTLLNEAESLTHYLKRDDTFFYTQVYDPEQKTLSEADRGEIRVGQRYQADVPAQTLDDPIVQDQRRLEDLETLIYSPENELNEQQIEQYLTVAKSIGTYARALDCSGSVKQPSLLMSAASASRDVTIQYAMDILHECNYDIAKAVCRLVPKSGPVLCRDEMEEWSTAETSLFDEAIDKFEKRFDEIQQNFLPWKSMKNLIEYFYFWKTTDRYVQRKRVKAAENESKLKQVFVPNFNKQNQSSSSASSSLLNGLNDSNVNKQCESCKKTSSSNWHVWGPTNLQYFLCQTCWSFWRKFGAFKYPNRLADMTAEKLQVSSNLPIAASSTSTSSSLAATVNNQSINNNNNNNNNNIARASPIITDLNSPYSCRECNKVFTRQERLISHLASHRQLHKCNVTSCGKEFKFKAHLARHCATSHGVAIRSGSPRPIMKTRAAFIFKVVPSLRMARTICADILNLKRAARKPYSLNIPLFKHEYTERYQKGFNKHTPKLKKIDRGNVCDISHRLGTPKMPKPEWLIALPKDKLPQPKRLAFPPTIKSEEFEPEDMSDSNKDSCGNNNNDIGGGSGLGKKRSLEQNGNFMPSKRRQMAPPSILGKSVPDLYENISRNSVTAQSLNGRAKIATITNLSGKKQMISWVDAPEDVYFVSTKKIKQMRRKIPLSELLRSARQPYKLHSEYLSSLISSSTATSTASGGGQSSQVIPNPIGSSSSSSSTLRSGDNSGAGGGRSHHQSSAAAEMIPSSTTNLNLMHNNPAAAAAAAAAALNLAGIGPLSSSSSPSSQQMAALLQQQMLAQNLPLLGAAANANHLLSPNAFFNNISPTNGGNSSGGGKMNR